MLKTETDIGRKRERSQEEEEKIIAEEKQRAIEAVSEAVRRRGSHKQVETPPKGVELNLDSLDASLNELIYDEFVNSLKSIQEISAKNPEAKDQFNMIAGPILRVKGFSMEGKDILNFLNTLSSEDREAFLVIMSEVRTFVNNRKNGHEGIKELQKILGD